jgi:putative addiction module component (TIGR02574 family)
MVLMATADELLRDVLKLPSKDRARLAHELLLSLEERAPHDTDAESEWTKELDRRVQDVIAGKVKLVSVEESNRRAAEVIERVRRER